MLEAKAIGVVDSKGRSGERRGVARLGAEGILIVEEEAEGEAVVEGEGAGRLVLPAAAARRSAAAKAASLADISGFCSPVGEVGVDTTAVLGPACAIGVEGPALAPPAAKLA